MQEKYRKSQHEKKKIKIRRLRNCLKVIIEFKRKCWLKNESEKGNPWLLLSKQWYCRACAMTNSSFSIKAAYRISCTVNSKCICLQQQQKTGPKKIPSTENIWFYFRHWQKKCNFEWVSKYAKKKLLTISFNI